MGVSDRRQHPRLECEFAVDLLNMGDDPTVPSFEAIVPGKALDVSRQGMRLQVGYDVPVGTILSVIGYYEQRESVCLCEVMWKRESNGEWMYGLYINEWSRLDSRLAARFNAMESQEELLSPAMPLGSVKALA